MNILGNDDYTNGVEVSAANAPGAALARLELRTALRAFCERVVAFRLADRYEYDPLPTAMLQGPRRLQIMIDAEAAVA